MADYAWLTDDQADELIELALKKKKYQQLPFGQLVEVLAHDLKKQHKQVYQNKPLLSDEATIEMGQSIFQRLADVCLLILGHYSLPYCYASAEGVRVLYFSEKIRNQTELRLRDTAHFVLKVMRNGSLASGLMNEAVAQVRIRHALVRYYIKQRGGITGNRYPAIHQEEMAGTLLAFSLITIKGLRAVGYELTERQEQAFLSTWNEIGLRLGIMPELLPGNYREALNLEGAIRAKHFAPATEAKILTQALLAVLNKYNSMPGISPAELMAFWMDERVLKLLDLPPLANTVKKLFIKNMLRTTHSINGLLRPHAIYSFEKELYHYRQHQ